MADLVTFVLPGWLPSCLAECVRFSRPLLSRATSSAPFPNKKGRECSYQYTSKYIFHGFAARGRYEHAPVCVFPTPPTPRPTGVSSFLSEPSRSLSILMFLFVSVCLSTPSTGAAGFMNGFAGPRPPSTAQDFLTRLRCSLAECAQDLQQTMQKARDENPLAGDSPAMELFSAAADHLNTAQHMATTLATPLELAEQLLFQFKAAVKQHAHDGIGATSSGFGTSEQEVNAQASTVQRIEIMKSINH